jgi:hypothetical protein
MSTPDTSAPATASVTIPIESAPPAEAPAPVAEETVSKAELEKIQREARKWEDRAKANVAAARELEKLRTSSLSEQEQAVAAAREAAQAEARQTFGGRLVAAEVKAAAAGRSVDVDALLEGIDASRLLTEEGEPDTDAISAWIDRVSPRPETEATAAAPSPFPDLGQGPRGGETLALNGDPLLADLKSALGIR